MVNLASDDPTQRERLGRFDLLYADGQSVVWAARFLGVEVPERVTAGDFIAPFCQRCAERGVRLFLIGGQPGVAEQTARLWREAAPGLQVVGTAHGFLNETQETALIETIAHAAPDVILVGMGSPRQEIWAERWAGALAPARLWCVGALFEYSGQGRPRAPRWMRHLGLEWLFRLVLEPVRLWKRYLIGNPLFIGRVLRPHSRNSVEPPRPRHLCASHRKMAQLTQVGIEHNCQKSQWDLDLEYLALRRRANFLSKGYNDAPFALVRRIP
jgi:N-acetylglucosaminyldiphosphoundecaprenol N-acetyl-beta-D-mannosaminyltransferase